jgi:hypothetical protein
VSSCITRHALAAPRGGWLYNPRERGGPGPDERRARLLTRKFSIHEILECIESRCTPVFFVCLPGTAVVLKVWNN